jgi:plastocyanin
MDNETLFYVFGIAAAISAVAISFVALKVKSFPGKASPLVIAWFAILLVGASTFAVKFSAEEAHHREAELEQAGEEFEAEGNDDAAGAGVGDAGDEFESEKEFESEEGGSSEEGAGSGGGDEAAAKGPGGTLAIAADPTDIAYDKASLSSKPGKVTIDFTNPATIEHDVAIEDSGGEEIAATEVITESEASTSAELAAGEYTFFCTVPGHREAGMEGPLTVK